MEHSVVMEHSGEVIITVECHGERWCASNWTGVEA